MGGVGASPKVTVVVGGRAVPVIATVDGDRVTLAFGDQVEITTGGELSVEITAAA
jgi:hypothetical protein